MYIATYHRTLMGFDRASGRLRQVSEEPALVAGLDLIDIPDSTVAQLKAMRGTVHARFAGGGPLDGCEYIPTSDPETFTLRRNGRFGGANQGSDAIEFDREAVREWELFRFVAQDVGRDMLRPILTEQDFADRVTALRNIGTPVCLHFGCGPRLIDGFLNIDKNAYLKHADNYFIFDFADRAWPIPDASVDYIYSEDFIEHIPQRNQIAFLAESLRVLKAGGINRVNTPCLRESMKRSDFTRGYAGVYFYEFDQWLHVALFTPDSLKELALIVGYRHVFLTAKSRGTSPWAVPDFRPDGDRDDVLGNIFADLVK